MTFRKAVKRDVWVEIYNEHGSRTASIHVGGKKEDGVKEFTGSTVIVQSGGWLITYDENGRKLNTKSGPR